MPAPGRQGSPAQKEDKSLGYFHGEAATSSIENAGIGYQAPSMIAGGAQARDVAMSSTLLNLVFSFLLLKVVPRIYAKQPGKSGILIIALFNALGWLPLVCVLVLIGHVSTVSLLALWLLSLIPTTLLTPLRDNWLAELVPGSRMGRYLGLRSAISAATYLGSFYVMARILDSYAGQIFTGYGIIFFMAFVASLGSCVLFMAVKAPKAGAEADAGYGLYDFIMETRKGRISGFLIYIISFTFAVSLAGPLFAVYMLKDLGFSYSTYTLMFSVEYLVRISSMGFWGRYVDKVGSVRVMVTASRLIPVIPVLWLFSANVGYLMLVQSFSGALWAAFDLCNQAYIYQAAPSGKKFRYILYHRSLTTLSLALGALAGGYLLGRVPPVFGNPILGIFLVSGLLRLAVVLFILPRVSEPGPGQDSPVLIFKRPALKGLFYQPHLWPAYCSQTPARGEILSRHARKQESPIELKYGLFYQPELWPKSPVMQTSAPSLVAPDEYGLFHRPELWLQPPVVETSAPSTVKPDRYGLFYQPELWPQLVVPAVMGPQTAASEKNGLFYKPELWTECHPAPAATTVTRAYPARYGLFYHPERWEQYCQATAPQPVKADTGIHPVPERKADSAGIIIGRPAPKEKGILGKLGEAILPTPRLMPVPVVA